MNNVEENTQMPDMKLTVSLNGKPVTIDVLNIIKNNKFNREYIIYTIDNLEDSDVFASILNESETTYSLDTIETEEEIKFVKDHIQTLIDIVRGNEDGNKDESEGTN